MKWTPIFPLLLLTITSLFAQAPEKMSYQAVIRDNSNTLVTNSEVDLKIIVRQGSAKGTAVYEETHYTTTNSNGLVSLQIGTGLVSMGNFKNINWAKGYYFVESQVDPTGSGNFSITGVSQMLSVPYSLHSKTAENFAGTVTESQIVDLYHYSDADIDGFESAFEGWDKDNSDDFDGKYSSLSGLPDIYTKNEIIQLISGDESPGRFTQSLTLTENELSISGGNSISFENWDRDASDDFSGNYSDLENKPELFSGSYLDLQDVPNIYTTNQVDSLVVANTGSDGVAQSLNLNQDELSISGGNSISFEGWDTDSSDDFSGDYIDLKNKPELFSGDFYDLINTPEIYTKDQVDSLMITRNGSEGSVQSLNLEGDRLSITGGNTISLGELSGAFSGDYADLENRPELFSGDFNDLINTPELFSGNFQDLAGTPQLYSRNQVDSLIVTRSGSEGSIQSLNLEGDRLSITGGNTISLGELSGGFSGDYADLENRPELFSGDFNDLINTPELFSGNFQDLAGTPQLYTKNQVDSLIVTRSGSEGSIQSLNLEGEELKISGGNTISFEKWDTDSTDDFSGSFLDLSDKPELFSGNFEDLLGTPQLYTRSQVDSLIVTRSGSESSIQNLSLEGEELKISGGNTISFAKWDMDNSDDFSGDYFDLKHLPQMYTTEQVDSLVATIEVEDGAVQSLLLDGSQLSISGSNSISFEKWDTNASDDFDGYYSSLIDAPAVYTKPEIDELLAVNRGNGEPGDTSQFLTLNEEQLSISNGNTISFVNWDRDATDDFDGNYSSLKDTPKVYTQAQVDSIKADLLEEVERIYYKKPVVVTFASSRNITFTDIGNTIACTNSATLTITSNFKEMKIGQTINLEAHGTTLSIKATSGVRLNGVSAGNAGIGNDEAFTGGILRKTGANNYIVL